MSIAAHANGQIWGPLPFLGCSFNKREAVQSSSEMHHYVDNYPLMKESWNIFDGATPPRCCSKPCARKEDEDGTNINDHKTSSLSSSRT